MGEVRVRFLGCGDAFGSGGRFQACILVSSADTRVLLDCGASSLIACKHFDVDPQSVQIVALSHLHGDHFGGLPFLILDGQFSGRTQPLFVAGPPGTAARLEAAMEALFPGSSHIRRRFEVHVQELQERMPAEMAGVGITAYPVRHDSGAPSFGLRVACGGKTIAYSGDTEWTETMVELAQGTDLLICEAYTLEKEVPGHMAYAALRRHSSELRAERIVLTHMSQDMIRREGVEHLRAEDGLALSL